MVPFDTDRDFCAEERGLASCHGPSRLLRAPENSALVLEMVNLARGVDGWGFVCIDGTATYYHAVKACYALLDGGRGSRGDAIGLVAGVLHSGGHQRVTCRKFCCAKMIEIGPRGDRALAGSGAGRGRSSHTPRGGRPPLDTSSPRRHFASPLALVT